MIAPGSRQVEKSFITIR